MVLKGRRLKLHVAASKLHKWLALIIGAQLLIWFASGTLMSFLSIEKVRGEHLVERNHVEPFPEGLQFANAATVAAKAKAPVASVTYRMLDGRPVAQVETGEQELLFDGATGTLLPPVDAATAMRVARAAWKGTAKPQAAASRVTQESPEYRGALPAWRIAFADPDHTSVFVTASTGKIAAVRTGTWRLYDFFWSLHIMDWKNHEDFNTPWLLAFAIGGLLLGLAGTVLLFIRWPIGLRRART